MPVLWCVLHSAPRENTGTLLKKKELPFNLARRVFSGGLPCAAVLKYNYIQQLPGCIGTYEWPPL